MTYKISEVGRIPTHWDVKVFKDFVFFQEGPGLRRWQFTESGMKVLNVTNIKGDGLIDMSITNRHISNEEFEKTYKHFLIQSGDIVIAASGNTIGKIGRIYDDQLPAIVNTSTIRFNNSLLPEELDQNYLYAYLRSSTFFEQLISYSTGSAQPNVGPTHIAKMYLPVPPMIEQKVIGKITESIESKISLNREINKTLEDMAQAIFKSWFVDFDPVKAKMNGEQPEGMDATTASLFPEKLDNETGIPEGWKLSEIGDEVAVVGGGTPSKKNDDFWVDGHIHWTSPKDLSGVQDKVLLDTASKLTEAGLKKVSSGLLPVDTVLLSSRAPVGYLALAKVPLAVNQGYIAMKCEKVLPPEFVLQWCVHRMDEIKQRASGSTFAEISKKNFKPISVVVPSEDVLSAYQKLVKPLYDAITSNVRQSEQLSTLRDTLLPKLLSGEIELGQAQELAEVE